MKKLALVSFFFTAAGFLAAQQSLHLPIGDPARKDREAKVVLDAITSTATGDLLTPREAAVRLAETRLVFFGESHTAIEFHKAQKRVIEELHDAGHELFIGLEMFPYTEQQVLDDWCEGLLTESGFVRLSRWYKNWGYHWHYYRDIFMYARDHGIRMFALNAPREAVSAVSRKGLDNLSPEEKVHIAPAIDVTSEEHFRLFRAFFQSETGMHSMMSEDQARAMFAAQCTWDATMGYNAVQALKKHGGEDTKMVVLIGSGHVAYGLGIQRQSSQWFDGKMACIIPIQVIDDSNRRIDSVQASYADFVWGLPPEENPLYPELGLATSEVPGGTSRRVLSVAKISPAGIAGFQVGDVLISMDGISLTDGETFNRLMAEKRWGDSAVFVVRRTSKEAAADEITLKVHFRRRISSRETGAAGK